MHAAARALLKAADALAQTRTRPARARSPRQQEIAANLSLASRTWRTLSDSQRHAWTLLGQTWSPTPGKAAAKGIVVFQGLNAVRLNTGQTDILRDAPAQPGTGTFALSVTSPAFDGLVQSPWPTPTWPSFHAPPPPA